MMTRKRSWYTRVRAKQGRPKHPAPRDGFLLAEDARLTGVPVRTLRDYVHRGLLHYSERRGTLTRYPRSEIVRLLGALRLKAQTRSTWAEVKRRIDLVSSADLERWLAEPGLASTLAAELGIARHEPHSELSTEHADAAWHRTELLPGLALLLSATASPAVRHAAQRIIDDHVGR